MAEERLCVKSVCPPFWKCIRLPREGLNIRHFSYQRLFWGGGRSEWIEILSLVVSSQLLTLKHSSLWKHVRGYIRKFPDCPPGARTANGTTLCHYVQLYRYYVGQCSEFCRHNPLCCFTTSVYYCKYVFRYRLSPETFGYILVYLHYNVEVGVHIIRIPVTSFIFGASCLKN
jgi:hypothetical protein